MSRLVLMCGLPGSGKTTTARRIADALPALRLAPDEWLHNLGLPRTYTGGRARVESLQWQLAQALLRLGTNVILESGFWSRRERDSCRVRARDLGAQVELRFLTAPPDDLWRRLQARDADLDPAARVTPAQLAEWETLFEPPDLTEMRLFDPPTAE